MDSGNPAAHTTHWSMQAPACPLGYLFAHHGHTQPPIIDHFRTCPPVVVICLHEPTRGEAGDHRGIPIELVRSGRHDTKTGAGLIVSEEQ